jgi:WD40 repeat protein
MKISFFPLLLALPLSAATVDYEKQLFPLLKDNCLPCHNKTTTKGGLNMETVELMFKGGDTGPSIVSGDGAKSILHQAAAGEWDSEMPPKNNKVSAVTLTSSQLALLKQWIDEGAHHAGKQERVIQWEPLPAGFTPIYATALTRDGHYAAAARGNQVSLYHLPTAKLLTRLTDEALVKSGLYQKPGVAHQDVVPALAFSPEGDRLVTGSFREVKVWRRTSKPSAAPAAPAVPFKYKLAAAGPDGVNVIDAASGKTLLVVKHGAALSAFALSPNQTAIATAGADHKIKLWEAATGKLTREIIGDATSQNRLAVASMQADRAAIEVSWWTEQVAKTQKEVSDLDARLKKTQELAATAQKTLEDKRKDAQAKAAAKTASDSQLSAIQQKVAQAPAGKPDAALLKTQTDALGAATKAAEASKTAAEALSRAESAVKDASTEIENVTRLKAQATALATSAQSSLESGKKNQATTAAAKAKETQAHAEAVPGLRVLTFSPDDSQLAGLDATGNLRTWAVASGIPLTSTTPSTALRWTNEGGLVVTSVGNPSSSDPTKTAWTLERTLGPGPGPSPSPISDRVNALAFSPDGKTLAVGSGEPSRSGDITLWNLADGMLKARWDEVHIDSVLSLDFSPDGKHLASGGADKALRIVDTATGKTVKVLEGHTHHVLGVSWRADGRLLASAGADNVVKIWDWTTGERRQNIIGWDKEVSALRYLGATDTLVTVSGDAKVRILSSAGAEIKTLPGAKDFLSSLSTTPSGDRLIAGGQDGTLHTWSPSTAQPTATFPVTAP